MTSQVVVCLLGVLLGLLSLFAALRAGRRRRLIDNLPTSKTTGVFIGQVELKGTAESAQPLVSYLAERLCVHYKWSVDEHWSRTVTETYTDSEGKTQTRTRHESGWETVASGGEQSVFYLRDDCGVVLVNPDRAEVEPVTVFETTCDRGDPLYYAKGPAHAVSNSDHRRRFFEEAIPLHARIYVMGPARERDDVVAPEIRYRRDTPLFLISTRSEARISAGLNVQFWCCGVLFVVLCAGGVIGLDYGHQVVPADPLTWQLTVVGAALATWALGWLWMAYNSMVGLRQRVRQAWANVDVQLKRRNDLIPNLVRAVEGLRDHERHVQAELAELRSQLLATAPGQAGPDPRGCASLLRGIIEHYPELKADKAFMKLQQNLIDTEQRISLARGYFNSIATFYNTRLQVIPDRFVAAISVMKPQPLIAATDFERAAVHVNLVSGE
ncbi:MAG: LemA family protein [Phycisphaerae bacterium]|jgi:hypothetical protein